MLGAPAANADRDDYDVTEVRYGPADKTKAQLVLAYLGGAGKLVSLDSTPAGADVVVVLGRDFRQVTAPATSTSGAAPTARRHARAPRPRPVLRPIRAAPFRKPAASTPPNISLHA